MNSGSETISERIAIQYVGKLIIDDVALTLKPGRSNLSLDAWDHWWIHCWLNADRILVLANGQVEALGTHDELISRSGRYAELFELPAAGYR